MSNYASGRYLLIKYIHMNMFLNIQSIFYAGYNAYYKHQTCQFVLYVKRVTVVMAHMTPHSVIGDG